MESSRPPRPRSLIYLDLESALHYRASCRQRPSSDDLVDQMRVDNERDVEALIEELTAAVCAVCAAGGHCQRGSSGALPC